MLYLLQLDARIRHASHDPSCVDDLVLALLERRRNDQLHGILEWKEMLVRVLGGQALRDFDAMNKGELIRLPANTFGLRFDLSFLQQRELDFGFQAASFFKRQVSGLREYSPAAEAGIQEGDEIVWSTYVWQCQTHYNRQMVMNIRRHGDEDLLTVEFWPRGNRLVESWNVSKVYERTGSAISEGLMDLDDGTYHPT